MRTRDAMRPLTESQFGALEGPELVEEYLAVVDLAQSSYIEAVRQGRRGRRRSSLGRGRPAVRSVRAGSRVTEANNSGRREP